ncbi:hypothetical protein CBS14141_002341 [Malassezia furfur]|nr:hypothetical protein CBS14141_002341 [Malassezia furfur]
MAAHAHLLRGVRAFRTRASARAVQREVDREMRQAYRPPAWAPAAQRAARPKAGRLVRDWDAWPAEVSEPRAGDAQAAPVGAQVPRSVEEWAEAEAEAEEADEADVADLADMEVDVADIADLVDADVADAPDVADTPYVPDVPDASDAPDAHDAPDASPAPLSPALESLLDRLEHSSSLAPPEGTPLAAGPSIPPHDAEWAPDTTDTPATPAAALASWDVDVPPPSPALALDASEPLGYEDDGAWLASLDGPLEPSASAEPSAAVLEALAGAPEALDTDDLALFLVDSRGAAAAAAEPMMAVRPAAAPTPTSARPPAPQRGVRDVYDWRTTAVSQRDVGMHGRPASQLFPAFDAHAWVKTRRWPTLSLLLRTGICGVHKALQACAACGRAQADADAGTDAALAVAVRHYQQRWRTALTFEREHTEAELAALRARPVAELTALGVAFDGLEAYWQTERHYGRRVAVFKLPAARRLPRHKLQPGAVVDVCPSDARADWLVAKEAVPHRTLALVDQLAAPRAADAADAARPAERQGRKRPRRQSRKLLPPRPAFRTSRASSWTAYEHIDLAGVPTWRLDRGTSRVVDERTDAALDALLYDADDVARASTPRRRYALVGTPLRAALVGTAPAPAEGLFARDMRIRSWYERYAAAEPLVLDSDPALGLNASQTRAVAMMLKEPLSLVQGPPGTGKTRTLVQAVALLKQHFVVPQPVLLAAHTNVAVDNLALPHAPALAAFPNAAFYGGALRDAPSTQQRAPLASAFAAHAPDGTPHAVTLLTHAPVAPSAASAAGGLGGVSPYNAPQGDLALALLCDLLVRNPTLRGDEIGIVTPYEAQVRLLERMLAAGACAGDVGVPHDAPGLASLPLLSEYALHTLAHTDAARAAQLAHVEVHTVDGFEGREKRVMLFSTVKAGGGTWRGAPRCARRSRRRAPRVRRRLPAGATRGARRSQLFILGNLDTLLSARLGRSGEEAVERSDVHAIRAYARWLLARGCVLESEAVWDRLLAQAGAGGCAAGVSGS